MRERETAERDWQLFKERIPVWQEAYMDRLNKEYIDLLSKDDSPSEKFWRLDERIKADRKKVGVVAEMSRSKLIFNLVDLIDEGAIEFKDLDAFSDELKETVRMILRIPSPIPQPSPTRRA